MPKSAIITKNGLPILKINNETVLPCGYMSYQIDKADYSGFIACGYKLIFVPVYMGDRGINPMSGIRPFYPGFWMGKDRYDFSVVDCDIEDWKKAEEIKRPLSVLTEQDCIPDKVVRVLQPKCIYSHGDIKLYDIGENVAGYAVIKFHDDTSHSGVCDIRYAENINDAYDIGCDLQRKRVECAIAVKAKLAIEE